MPDSVDPKNPDPKFASTNEEAQKRFQRFEAEDPLPEIAPALLNSADIEEYVSVIGMVYPFHSSQKDAKLKSASYEVDFFGDLHVTDSAEGYRKIVIQKDVPYRLRKNSITFLFLDATFRLPDYMAARFNLRITHVHAGLLLGTGPLIDPGFAGRLLIPLHNLTSEDYLIKGGEGLIWVEFTKLSENVRWKAGSKRAGQYRTFPADKRYGTAEKYFEKASLGRFEAGLTSSFSGEVKPASSSIPGEIKAAAESAKAAQRHLATVRRFGIIGIITVLVAVLLSTYSVYSLIQDANKNSADASKTISDYRDHQIHLEKRINALETEQKLLRDAQKAREPSVAERRNPASSKGAERR